MIPILHMEQKLRTFQIEKQSCDARSPGCQVSGPVGPALMGADGQQLCGASAGWGSGDHQGTAGCGWGGQEEELVVTKWLPGNWEGLGFFPYSF